MKLIDLALGAAMLATPIPSSAQTARRAIVISGRVTQAGDTSVAVGGADVVIVGTAMRRYADGEGRFRFDDVPPGTYQLSVRSIGYEQASIRLVMEPGRAYEQPVELRRHPHALTEVRIEGRMLKVPARFEDVYARASHEQGTFFTRQDIDKLNPYDVGSLLNLVPTVYANSRGVTFQRCNPGLNGVRSSGGASAAASTVQVYIDGTRVTASKSTSPDEALHLVIPKDIEAMEVYTAASRIPAEFLADACAVIAIWTKSY